MCYEFAGMTFAVDIDAPSGLELDSERTLCMLMSRRTSHRLLAIIIGLYVFLGTLYAVETPKWQVPDEPAHFNFVRYVADEDELPVLGWGDYPHQYLEEIKAAGFPPEMSIDPIRYESWQPPLYYALASQLKRSISDLPFDTQFLVLRLFSVILGAAELWVVFRIVQGVFPNEPFLAVAATAFAATIPMHVAMTSGIGNDALAVLILSLILWISVRIAQEGTDLRHGASVGILLGLALLTKTTIYVAAAVVAAAVWVHEGHRKGGLSQRASRSFRSLLGIGALAMLYGVPWFLRNVQVYGWPDFLAWQRHSMVVAEQLRTADLVKQVGSVGLLRSFALTTFRSFWGQFGWMGVLLDARIYRALALWSALLAAGFGLFLIRMWQSRSAPESARKSRLTAPQERALGVLALAGVLTVLLYLAYNAEFVQHQGRYLFTALVPVSLGAALGLRELTRPRTARVLAVALLLVMLPVLAYGTLRRDLAGWNLVTLAAAAAVFVGAGWLPDRWRCAVPSALYVAFLALDCVSLYWYIVPAL